MRALALRDLRRAPHLQGRTRMAFDNDGDRTHHPRNQMHQIHKLAPSPTPQLIATEPGA